MSKATFVYKSMYTQGKRTYCGDTNKQIIYKFIEAA